MRVRIVIDEGGKGLLKTGAEALAWLEQFATSFNICPRPEGVEFSVIRGTDKGQRVGLTAVGTGATVLEAALDCYRNVQAGVVDAPEEGS